jgi:DNA-binding NarL/FixJ family response regulator
MNFAEFFPDPTFVIDNKGRVIAWNKAIGEITGIGVEKILGKGDYAYAVPFYGEPWPMLIDLALTRSTQKPKHYEWLERVGNTLTAEARLPNLLGGKGIYAWGTAFPLLDSEGDIFGAVETIRTVTDRDNIKHGSMHMDTDLQVNASQLREINMSLKVLLKAREVDRQDLDKRIRSNIRTMVVPHLDKLKKTRLDQNQKKYVYVLESALQEVLSPFLSTLESHFQNLTPAEIQVANFIREGKTSKEIADILNVVEKTIEIHRYNIRMKLGIKNKKINLRSRLLSLE